MKKLFVFACAALASLSVAAQTEDRPWSVGIYGGKVEAANDWGSHFMRPAKDFFGSASFTFSHYLNERFDVGVHGLWGRYGIKGGDIIPTDGTFKSNMIYGDVQGKFKFVKNEENLLHPFAFLSLGVRSISPFDKDNVNHETVREENKAINFVLGGGLGCDLRINEAFALRYFATYGWPFINGDRVDNRESGKFADQHLLHNLGIVYSFSFNNDKDGDGVANKFDECPDTPAGVKVDEKGCPIDSDHDGVADYLDKCPNTPTEAKVDSCGCPIDSDGDGVADYLDECPDTPAEAKGMVDEKGCPMDSDGDGVADYLDQCPGTPAAAKGMVDEKGCPIDTDGDGVYDYEDVCPNEVGVKANNGCPEIKEEVKKVFEKALNGIEFETGSAKIKKSSNKILDDVVTIMKENPSYKLSINGHTDNAGKADKNQVLSEDRAAAVKAYLENKGVEASRLTSAGFGQTQPVADNKTAKGRAKNRRVEFKVKFEK